MRIFVTFTSSNYKDVASRISSEAKATGFFDRVCVLDETMLSEELINCETFKIKKGYGLYSWKPDVIWQVLCDSSEGDIIVYCDAGCVIQKSREWCRYFTAMKTYDVTAFRIHQKNYQWVRKSVFDYFNNDIHTNWKQLFQFGANAVIIKNSNMGRHLVNEWRQLMINRLDLCGDVNPSDLNKEDPRFIENRYDQAILTGLLYKYSELCKINAVWENFEGYNPFRKQAIIAARNRKGRNKDKVYSVKHILWRFYRKCVLYPFYNITTL